ncbi:glutaredoxin family protein [Streptomyces albireticuli]|nr:glutaredoxin family protein [Streptomyces albireticuli]MCD9144858.1 glutaredoxin family protein [Streptomyces albireticuli]MCD9165727.1 glutaredoxin family protein [Streptomyces albireticuli]MCD9193765.1 glutaredoxin family protein [Streptomyces albireticuli]
MAAMTPLLGRRARKNPADSTVTLIGKPGCHLCDAAEAVITEVCGELGARWEKKDITQDEELHRKYWEQIPVVLVDGAQHDFWRVDPVRLRRALGG